MKPAFVADLQDGQSVSTFFLVRDKEIRTSANTGKSWLQLDLADRTGSLSAKMWDNFATVAQTFERDDVIRVRGRVRLYRGEKELTIEQILPAGETEYALEDFLPHTQKDVEQLYASLRQEIAKVGNPWLKKLLTAVVEDPEIAAKLKRAPAAMTMHHAYIGGLLEHVVSLCGLARHVVEHYPEVDADLLLAAIVLHDIGKIEELNYVRGIRYTTEGELLGHIVIGLGIVRRKIDAIPNFPRPLAAIVEHLIVSHHGEYEFGSPKLPAMREAVLFHMLDDLDSKMAAMRETLAEPKGEDEWTSRNPALRRNLLRAGDYLNPEEKRASGAAAAKCAAPARGAVGTRAGNLFSSSKSDAPKGGR
jgi:3'-5' exoribonuclease